MARLGNILFECLPPRFATALAAWKNYHVGERELRELRRIVPPRELAIDVGAHRGVYTYFLSRLADTVVAYEPNPALARYLRRAVGANVTVREVALGDRSGDGLLSIPVVDGRPVPGRARLASSPETSAVAHEVAIGRLDEENHASVGFIKIDVEGNEDSVLRGGVRTIRRDHPVLLIEIEQRHLAGPITDVFAMIEAMGYRGYFLRGGAWAGIGQLADALREEPERGNPASRQYAANFLFWPDARGTTPWMPR